MILKSNPKELVNTYNLFDISGCELTIEPLDKHFDGTPMSAVAFWELFATPLASGEKRRIHFFYTREAAYNAFDEIIKAAEQGKHFCDLTILPPGTSNENQDKEQSNE